MKLLSLNTYHYRRGGSDAVFLDHQSLFRDIGWATAEFCMQHPLNQPSPWEPFFVDEIEFGHSYSLRSKIKMAGKIIYSREARRKLAKLLDTFIPDIAHVHCIYHHISPSVLPLLKEREIPTVMTAHDLKLACPAYRMYNRTGICERCKGGNLLNVIRYRCIHDSLPTSVLVAIESAAHRVLGIYKRNLDRVIVPSRFFEQKLHEWGWPAGQLTYIPNAIEANQFTADVEPGEYFLYFGRLSSEKGVDRLIRAASLAKARIRIAGTGPSEQALQALALSLGANAEFLGYCSGNRLWSLVRGARAVVLPSEWYENAPISVLEAYACGKPVVGADVGGIPEMIIQGETGFVFNSSDTGGLASTLGYVKDMQRHEIRRLGENAIAHVRKYYDRSHYRDQVIRLYQELGVGVNLDIQSDLDIR